MAIGTNKYLEAHQDKDFCYSMVTVFKKESAVLEDKPIAYFCFPRLGTAVPLLSGDVLMFNPIEPHCLSSRCNPEDEIVCMSLYLKAAVAGLNDNKKPLTPAEVKYLINK